MAEDTAEPVLTDVQRQTKLGAILGSLVETAIRLHRLMASDHHTDTCGTEVQYTQAMAALAKHSGNLALWSGPDLMAAADLVFMLRETTDHAHDHLREVLGTKAISALIDLITGQDPPS